MPNFTEPGPRKRKTRTAAAATQTPAADRQLLARRIGELLAQYWLSRRPPVADVDPQDNVSGIPTTPD